MTPDYGLIELVQPATWWEALKKITLDVGSQAGWERLAQLQGKSEVSAVREVEYPDLFDYREDHEFHTVKAYKARRPFSKVRRVCIHQMAVQFGTTKAQREEWRKRLLVGNVHPTLKALLKPDLSNLDALSRRAAVHFRMRSQAPYHDKGLLNGDVLMCEPSDLVTWHGNGANAESYGLGLEGLYPGLIKNYKPGKYNALDAFTIDTFRTAVRLGVARRRAEGCPIEELEHHRQHSAARAGDSGEGIHREVAVPMAKELGLKIVHARKTGSGKVITVEWDDDSPFDAKGRLRKPTVTR